MKTLLQALFATVAMLILTAGTVTAATEYYIPFFPGAANSSRNTTGLLRIHNRSIVNSTTVVVTGHDEDGDASGTYTSKSIPANGGLRLTNDTLEDGGHDGTGSLVPST